MDIKELMFPYDGSKSLKDFSTEPPKNAPDKEITQEALERGIKRMRKVQDTLYADDRFSVLIIFQAMDAAGKDGTIKHVMSGINPQGCKVVSFKAPSHEELDHDYLWRCVKEMPNKGHIGIFNRSYYEEVLVVRVHPSFLAAQRIVGIDGSSDPGLEFWKQRFKDINHLEQFLGHNNTLIIKFFLHVSKDEQKQRFISRIDDPSKNWKFNMADVKERQHWDEYMLAYADMLKFTSTKEAPWYVIPADKKWFMRLAVSEIICQKLEELEINYPKVNGKLKDDIKEARRLLENEK
jgi:PPK2 family polyphosphate:nucleotide phosphotransferase